MAFPTINGTYSSVVVDLNADSKADVVTAETHCSCIAVLLGNADGTLRPYVAYDAAGNALGTAPIFVSVADFNGDAKLDVAVLDQNHNKLGVLLGNGDGTLQKAVHFGTGGNPVSLAKADFNGDGKPDLASANPYNNDVSILINTTP